MNFTFGEQSGLTNEMNLPDVSYETMWRPKLSNRIVEMPEPNSMIELRLLD